MTALGLILASSAGMKLLLTAALVAALLAVPNRLFAYSVLTHEANIDALWDTQIKPLLKQKYPRATEEELNQARAYAYGGCVIQDLGYYPFGSKFFSNLVHYQKSGEFVETLIANAHDLNEYAFAIGALGHYASDNRGHPMAVNKSVPLVYPKTQAKFGDVVTYEQDPKRHIMVEFSFDVVQVAGGAFAPDAYHRFIGFEVAKSLLDRTFQQVYGLELKTLFMNEDLAIGTYRHAVAKDIPQMTKVAWKKKREDIEKVAPGITEAKFVFNLSQQQYEKEFGTDYAKPKGYARVIGWLYHLVPKIGPLRPLSFTVPTPEAEKLFLESFKSTKERFGAELEALGAGKLSLTDTNMDLGRTAQRGEYRLADTTYDEWVKRRGEKLAHR